jgi:hypothetical protein
MAAAWFIVAIACATPAGLLACSASEASDADASPPPSDAGAPTYDLCDAFTGAGTTCATPGPFVCFPFCDGGCTCAAMTGGARWTCVTDLSCVPQCAPLEALDGECASSDADLGDEPSAVDGAGADAGSDAIAE